VPVAVHCRVFSGMFDEPFVKVPAACTVSVTAPPAVVRALTSRLTGPDVNVVTTSGSALLKVMLPCRSRAWHGH